MLSASLNKNISLLPFIGIAIFTKIIMESETDFSSDSDYEEFANEILIVVDILQPFQFEPFFTAAEIQDLKKDLVGTSVIGLLFDRLPRPRT